VPCGTREQSQVLSTFTYGAVTLFGRPFQIVQLAYGHLVGYLEFPLTVSRHRCRNASRLTLQRFRLLPLRSPLLGESRLISFPPPTEMFQFSGFAPCTLCIQVQVTQKSRVSTFGNPCITAWLPAPQGLSQVPTSFIASRRQDIHRLPLLT